MRRLLFIMLVALLPVIAFGGCDSRASEVKATDDAYDRALDSCNGTTAVAFLSKDSLEMLDKLMVAARTEGKKKIQGRTISEQITILTARMLCGTASELKKTTGRDYYIKVVNKGWGGSGLGMEREKIAVMKDRAIITYWDPSSESRSRWYYVLENGVWKDDHVTAASEYDREYRQMAKENNLTDEELVVEIISMITQVEEVPASLWSPPR